MNEPGKLNELLTPLPPDPPVISPYTPPIDFFFCSGLVVFAGGYLLSLDYDLKAELPTLFPLTFPVFAEALVEPELTTY